MTIDLNLSENLSDIDLSVNSGVAMDFDMGEIQVIGGRLDHLTVDPLEEEATYTATAGYNALESVTVKAMTPTTFTFTPDLAQHTAHANAVDITVEPIPVTSDTVTPSAEQQTVSQNNHTVTVEAVAPPFYDTSDATATSEDIVQGASAYGANGRINGGVEVIDTVIADQRDSAQDTSTQFAFKSNTNGVLRGSDNKLLINKTELGTANQPKVLAGYTFSSEDGVSIEGTMVSHGNLRVNVSDIPHEVEGEVVPFVVVTPELIYGAGHYDSIIVFDDTEHPVIQEERHVENATAGMVIYPGTGSGEEELPEESPDNPSVPYTAMAKVVIDSVAGAGITVQDSKTVSGVAAGQTVTPDEGYDGIAQVIVGAVPSVAETVTPSRFEQVAAANNHTVTVSAVPTETGAAVPAVTDQTILPTAGKYFDEFYVAAIPSRSDAVTPTTTQQTVSQNNYAVTVNPIPAEYITTADADATAADIKRNKTAYVNGEKIIGTHDEEAGASIQPSKTVAADISGQTIRPDLGYDAVAQVTVEAVPAISDTVTPTEATQTVSGNNHTVTVAPIPEQYIIPAGSAEITENGTYDVTNIAEAVVSVQGGGGDIPEYDQNLYAAVLKLLETNGTYFATTQTTLTTTAVVGDLYLLTASYKNDSGSYVGRPSQFITGATVYKMWHEGTEGQPSGNTSMYNEVIILKATASTISCSRGSDGCWFCHLDGNTEALLQSKTVEPSTAQQVITPDTGYDGLSSVTIAAMPSAIEMETGTWTPTEDIARGTVSFANAHSSPPDIIVMSYAGGTADTTANSNYAFSLFNAEKVGGTGLPYSATVFRKALAYYNYRSTNTGSTSVGGITVTQGKSNATASSTAYYRYWATATEFRPYSNSTSRFWRAGKSYNWVAIWL